MENGQWLHIEESDEESQPLLMSSFTKESRDDDVFKIFKANLDEIWETNFLISSAPILSSYLSFLKETAFHVSRDRWA